MFSRDSPLFVSDEAVAIFLFALSFFSLLSSSKWYALIPKMFYARRLKKEKEIATLEKEAESLNSPATFAQYARAQRQINVLQKELRDINNNYRARGWLANWAPYLMYYFIRFGFIVPAWALFREHHPQLVLIPNHFLLFNPSIVIEALTSASTNGLSVTGDGELAMKEHGGYGAPPPFVPLAAIGTIPWCIISQIAVRYIARVFNPRSTL